MGYFANYFRRLLAEASLHDLKLDEAEVAFVLCQHYQGIDFVKRLRNIQSETVRKVSE